MIEKKKGEKGERKKKNLKKRKRVGKQKGTSSIYDKGVPTKKTSSREQRQKKGGGEKKITKGWKIQPGVKQKKQGKERGKTKVAPKVYHGHNTR